ncbi:MAG: serine hydrolase [Nostocoides sp.]|uniref:serine hydrolase domain-containing protein n=1 Tax=Nostocoides sp. TaxID=1917966 RepID=UPI003C78D6EF
MTSETADATAPVHPYYAPEPDSAWARVDRHDALLPSGQPLVTLANWQEEPHLHWSFQHMREVMPSQVILGHEAPLALPERPIELGEVPVSGLDWADTVDQVLARTETDGFLVLKDGAILAERYTPPMVRRRRHLVMSVSKSIVSCVAGSLAGDGLLDPEASVETYVPELAASGYAGARVRTLLDMRSGIRFRETYLDPESEVRVMERSMGWAPRNHGDPLGMYPYILTIASEGEHGGVFTYRSIDTDTLGWVCERAAGVRMADLISDRVWQPIGAFHDAEVTADPLGSAIHDGGVSATLRDLGRFGMMLLQQGRALGPDGAWRQVVPAEWISGALFPPADVRDAFARSENEPYLPGGWYRNQFWFVPGDNGPILLCLGIHGQMVFVEPATGVVGVKLSSWPLPQSAQKLSGTIWMFREIARYLTSP